jgi:thymidylate kinase
LADSKLIVIEGAQGAGKTTITDYIRYSLSCTNLYRLSGTRDSSPTGLEKSISMYEILLDYIKKLENTSVNLLFDRTFFTEEVYCRLGKKQYSFTEEYNKLLERFSKLDFDIYYVTLYLDDESKYAERLERSGKAVYESSKFGVENSITQQKEYLKMSKEIEKKYPKIKVININTNRDFEIVKNEIREKIGF